MDPCRHTDSTCHPRQQGVGIDPVEQRVGRRGAENSEASQEESPGAEFDQVDPPESDEGIAEEGIRGQREGDQPPRRQDGSEDQGSDQKAGTRRCEGVKPIARHRDTGRGDSDTQEEQESSQVANAMAESPGSRSRSSLLEAG